MTSASPNSSDIHKHLDYIQATITRMAANSATSKNWMLTIVLASYGAAITTNRRVLAALGILAVIVCSYLDAQYLRRERRYRHLYVAVINGAPITQYSLDPDEVPPPQQRLSDDCGKRTPRWIVYYLPGPRAWLSWSILPLFIALMMLGLGIITGIIR